MKKDLINRPNYIVGHYNYSPISSTILPTLDSLFDSFLAQGFPWLKNDLNISFEQAAFPRVDIYKEGNGDMVIEADVHGYDDKLVSVEFDKKSRILKISGKSETKDADESKKRRYVRSEIKRSAFSRSFVVGEEYDDSKIRAENLGGLVKIFIPRLEEKKEDHIVTLL